MDKVLDLAGQAGLRKTRLLRVVVEALAEFSRPVTLKELESSEEILSSCDRTTLFRLLKRLQEKGLVRRIGLHERAAFFTLAMPGGHHDYLVCRSCGRVDVLEIACPVEALESEVAEKTGYSNLYHELEIYGMCPECCLK
ncbi:MAG: transcriptional repressor [Verrucomicrobiota bacterium]